MYEINIRTWIDGERQPDTIVNKTYVRLRNAEKAAKAYLASGKVTQEAIILPVMTSVTRNEAREAYCKCKDVWVYDGYGKERLRPSWDYGSHDTRESLFSRSIEQSVGWNYEGPYYIAY